MINSITSIGHKTNQKTTRVIPNNFNLICFSCIILSMKLSITKSVFITVILLSLCASAFADLSDIKDIIRDPSVSRRCKALLGERSDKIKVQQKLQSLLLRNKKLNALSNKKQRTVLSKLELSLVQLKNHLRLTKMSLKSMDENIVRKGCPGITL